MSAIRLIGLAVLAVLGLAVAGACSSDGDSGSSATADSASTASAPASTAPLAPTDPLTLQDGETIVFEVEVTLADDPSVVLWAPNCYTLFGDGTFDDPGFPSADAPVLGTWESTWDGTSASYLAQSETPTAVTLVQNGEVTVDEDTGEMRLLAETTVAGDGGAGVTVVSTGQAVENCTPRPG